METAIDDVYLGVLRRSKEWLAFFSENRVPPISMSALFEKEPALLQKMGPFLVERFGLAKNDAARIVENHGITPLKIAINGFRTIFYSQPENTKNRSRYDCVSSLAPEGFFEGRRYFVADIVTDDGKRIVFQSARLTDGLTLNTIYPVFIPSDLFEIHFRPVK